MSFKLIVGGDWGDDNGICLIGQFDSIEEAIAASTLPKNSPHHEWYGSYVEDRDSMVVAESNDYWGDKIPAWHTNL